ncbi:MAG: Amidase, partial [Propionibacteriaceae bacterium]|nr:Amidase [Propionibacteriaceae bacterium]
MRKPYVTDRLVTRRNALALGAGGAAAVATGLGRSSAAPGPGARLTSLAAPYTQAAPSPELEGMTVAELRSALDAKQFSVRELVEMYLARIDALDRNGPRLRSVLEVNPEAVAIADALDQELQGTGARGPLHGIPILLKDNIDTADQMLTTAGSLALVNSRPRQDAFVARRLRDAGAVLLGKTNLSEWANFRSFHA